MKYFIYDVETGGKTTKYSLLSFYGVVCNDKFEIVDELSPNIRHEKYILQAEAMRVNQINLVSHDKEALDLSLAQKRFNDWILTNSSYGTEKLINTGHSVSFDKAFVAKYLCRDLEKYVTRHNLDTGTLALILKSIGRLPDSFEVSLKNLANYYKIVNEVPHNAKYDVLTTLAVLKCMLAEIREDKQKL